MTHWKVERSRKVALEKVHYKEVALRLAERSFANRGLKVPDFRIRALAARYETRSKALNKKKKSGEI